MKAWVVTGLGAHVLPPGQGECDGGPYLKHKKMRKFMGLQDALAVMAAGRALESAGLLGALPPERTGLYLAVGYLPFERGDIDRLLDGSLDEAGRVSMERFSTSGYAAVNPLVTFRCLSNMPAFHVSLSFDIQGPYLVSYPGPGQLYQALDAAEAALEAGSIDVAVVVGVAHQSSFLVQRHFARLLPPEAGDGLRDAAACLVLERAERAAARGAPVRARAREVALEYAPFHPFEEAPAFAERLSPAPADSGQLGPASLPAALAAAAAAGARQVAHDLRTRDGLLARSVWEVAP